MSERPASREHTRLIVGLGFLSVFSLMLLVAWLSVATLQSVNADMATLVRDTARKTDRAFQMRDAIRLRTAAVRSLQLVTDIVERERVFQRLVEQTARYDRARRELGAPRHQRARAGHPRGDGRGRRARRRRLRSGQRAALRDAPRPRRAQGGPRRAPAAGARAAQPPQPARRARAHPRRGVARGEPVHLPRHAPGPARHRRRGVRAVGGHLAARHRSRRAGEPTHRAPGEPRRPDRAPQPPLVREPARAHPRRRPARRRRPRAPLPRSRSLQDRQRHLRSPRRRPAPDRADAHDLRSACAAATCSPGSAATSSRSSPTRSPSTRSAPSPRISAPGSRTTCSSTPSRCSGSA